MPKTISKAIFARLCRSPGFIQQMKDIHLTSGITVQFLDFGGNTHLCCPDKGPLELERFIARHEFIQQQILKRRLSAAIKKEYKGGSLPWTELVHPMTAQEEVVGYWVLTPFRTGPVDSARSKGYWERLQKRGISISWTHWKRLLKDLPEWSPQQISAWKRQLKLQDHQARKHVEAETGKLPSSEKLSPMILKACRLIREQYAGPLRLHEIARQCQISPEHLSRSFHRQTGLRFSDYVAETRIHAVCERLVKSNDPISEIAGEHGFSTLSRFNQCFRTITGTTPRAWRNKNQTESTYAF